MKLLSRGGRERARVRDAADRRRARALSARRAALAGVGGDEAAAGRRVRALGEALGVEASLARDGLELMVR